MNQPVNAHWHGHSNTIRGAVQSEGAGTWIAESPDAPMAPRFVCGENVIPAERDPPSTAAFHFFIAAWLADKRKFTG